MWTSQSKINGFTLTLQCKCNEYTKMIFDRNKKFCGHVISSGSPFWHAARLGFSGLNQVRAHYRRLRVGPVQARTERTRAQVGSGSIFLGPDLSSTARWLCPGDPMMETRCLYGGKEEQKPVSFTLSSVNVVIWRYLKYIYSYILKAITFYYLT